MSIQNTIKDKIVITITGPSFRDVHVVWDGEEVEGIARLIFTWEMYAANLLELEMYPGIGGTDPDLQLARERMEEYEKDKSKSEGWTTLEDLKKEV